MPEWRSDGWTQVAETGQPYEGELIALRLRAAGIEAKVVDQTFRQEPLPSVRSFAVVRVLVPEGEEAQAREVLARSVELPPDAESVADSADEKGSEEEEGKEQ
jgi:hypothetical protein